jgi:hypothetical protein
MLINRTGLAQWKAEELDNPTNLKTLVDALGNDAASWMSHGEESSPSTEVEVITSPQGQQEERFQLKIKEIGDSDVYITGALDSKGLKAKEYRYRIAYKIVLTIILDFRDKPNGHFQKLLGGKVISGTTEAEAGTTDAVVEPVPWDKKRKKGGQRVSFADEDELHEYDQEEGEEEDEAGNDRAASEARPAKRPKVQISRGNNRIQGRSGKRHKKHHPALKVAKAVVEEDVESAAEEGAESGPAAEEDVPAKRTKRQQKLDQARAAATAAFEKGDPRGLSGYGLKYFNRLKKTVKKDGEEDGESNEEEGVAEPEEDQVPAPEEAASPEAEAVADPKEVLARMKAWAEVLGHVDPEALKDFVKAQPVFKEMVKALKGATRSMTKVLEKFEEE